MSHKLSELGIQHDGFICFNNPNEVVSDKEFEEIKNELANMRKEALKMLAEKKNDNDWFMRSKTKWSVFIKNE